MWRATRGANEKGAAGEMVMGGGEVPVESARGMPAWVGTRKLNFMHVHTMVQNGGRGIPFFAGGGGL